MYEDIAELKESLDLVDLVAKDLGSAANQSGRWWRWVCPFHDDHDPSLAVTADNGRWKCFGCGLSGDHVDWLVKYHGMAVGDAIRELRHLAGQPEWERLPARVPATLSAADDPPSPTWQKASREFLAYTQPLLWTAAGIPGLAYLRSGGLTDETSRSCGLGWNPHDLFGPPDRWGLDGGKKMSLRRGIVIPCEVAGVLWYVKTRRFDEQGLPATDGPKYTQLRGGRSALYGADDLRADGRPLVLCEGERDAMLVRQELSDLVDVTTLGGAGKEPDGRWCLRLLSYQRILVAFDSDDSGRQAAEKLTKLSQRMAPVKIPHGSDLADFHSAGGDLRALVNLHLREPHTVCLSDVQSAGPLDLLQLPNYEAEAVLLMREDPTTPEAQLDWCRRHAALMTKMEIPCIGYTSWDEWLTDGESALVPLGNGG